MGALSSVLIVVQVLSALGMIGLVLLQQGKGADMGASFGSGASGTLFGASGSANVLSRSTAVLATIFFATTLALVFMGSHRIAAEDKGSVLDRPVQASAPAAASATGAALVPKAAPQQPAASAASPAQ